MVFGRPKTALKITVFGQKKGFFQKGVFLKPFPKKENILFGKRILYSGMKAQVATEYLLITGFILAIATVMFTYSYVSNNQNIRVSQANNALDKLANAADLVYATGPENVQFPEIILPSDIQVIRDIAVCNNLYNEHAGLGEDACDGAGQNGVYFGAIEMQVSLLGGTSTLSRPLKAEAELDTGTPFPTEGGFYRIKVYWCDPANNQKICLEKA